MAPQVVDGPAVVEQPPVVTNTQIPAVSRAAYVTPFWYRAAAAVWFVVGLIDVLLAFDFLFRALKANDVGFANFIYNTANVFASPFDGIFGVNITNNAYVLRWGDLLGIAIYTLIGLAIVKLMRIAFAQRVDTMGTAV